MKAKRLKEKFANEVIRAIKDLIINMHGIPDPK